jgi:hypothetical protein
MKDEEPAHALKVKLLIENTKYELRFVVHGIENTRYERPRFVMHPPQDNALAGGHQPETAIRRIAVKPDANRPVKGRRYSVVDNDGALCATTYIGRLNRTHYFDEVDKEAPVIRLTSDELHCRVLWTVADMNEWLAQHLTQGGEK